MDKFADVLSMFLPEIFEKNSQLKQKLSETLGIVTGTMYFDCDVMSADLVPAPCAFVEQLFVCCRLIVTSHHKCEWPPSFFNRTSNIVKRGQEIVLLGQGSCREHPMTHSCILIITCVKLGEILCSRISAI